MEPATIRKIAEWGTGDDTGLSSKYLARLALDFNTKEVAYPHDPSDFGRCLRFLQILQPAERTHVLHRAKLKSQQWLALVGVWDQAEALFNAEWPTGKAPKLYKLMKDIGL